MKHSKFFIPFLAVIATFSLGCEKKQESNTTKTVESSGAEVSSNEQKQVEADQTTSSETGSQADEKPEPAEPEWIGKARSLFDGKTLDQWETIEFGGEGDVEVEASAITMEAGVMMTGICAVEDEWPKTNYEISLDARKIDGTDFFLGLTFPVAESHCTLIVGGWGGTLVGLSCINDQDASSNDTAMYKKFEAKQWYEVRVRVQPEQITTWIDDEKVIDKNIAGKRISLRGDTDLCRPLGICNFMTESEYKNLQLREFKPMAPVAAPDVETKKASSLELTAPVENGKQ